MTTINESVSSTQKEELTIIILEAIEASKDKVVKIGDVVFGRAEDTNELVIVEKGKLLAVTGYGYLKDMAIFLWDWICRIGQAIAGFFVKLFNWLAGNGWTLEPVVKKDSSDKDDDVLNF